MNDTTSRPAPAREPSREEMMSALFANLVFQHTQLALMMLGKIPHPESGQSQRDLDHAQMLIDQLEMLEVKTKGNLSKEEESLLKQSLMTLRLAFVEAVETPPPQTKAEPAPTSQSAPPASAQQTDAAAPIADEESRKKFTKKY